jgi:hypothetical protein
VDWNNLLLDVIDKGARGDDKYKPKAIINLLGIRAVAAAA